MDLPYEQSIGPDGRLVNVLVNGPEAALREEVIRVFHFGLHEPALAREFCREILPRFAAMETMLLYLKLRARDGDEPVTAPQEADALRALGFPKASPGSVRQTRLALKQKLGPGWWDFFTIPKRADPITILRGDRERVHEVSPQRIDGSRGLEVALDRSDMAGEGHNFEAR